ncbi:MAG: YhcH/YjgK/YiaL family protein [Azospirillaceae bacterium]|nr:YhcH/YjgK/YiaL family protein [Azospirillaceae bacterium]
MFFGTLANWAEEKKLLPAAVVTVMDAVRRHDLAGLAVGRYEIDGTRSFFMIQEMVTKPVADTRPEAHRQYADIQIVLAGAERYGVATADPARIPLDDRLEASDLAFYPTPARESFIDLSEGDFAVFLPGDLHRPGCAIDGAVPIRKVVVKIHRSLLGL